MEGNANRIELKGSKTFPNLICCSMPQRYKSDLTVHRSYFTSVAFFVSYSAMGAHGGTFYRCTALQAGRPLVRFQMSFGIFHVLNPSGRTRSLRFTQPLSEISTRGISSRIKAAGAWGWIPRNSATLNLLQPLEPARPMEGLHYL